MCVVPDDSELPKFFRQVYRTARKRHVCVECLRIIQLGEDYEYTSGLWDGTPGEYKTCRHCLYARRWLEDYCNTYLFGGVLEDLEEHWNESYEYHSFWLARSIVGMRKQWKRKDGSLMPLPRVNAA